ncbi:MAG TPA: hypothetical protein VNR38_10115 [Ureibacillus sp.]|nr:hypothetical protein [Ureibacillus sp.]
MTKLKKVVLTLALICGFAVFTASPSEASINEIDPGPIFKTSSIGIGGFTLDR